jgi:hypothetical protein
MLVYLRCRDLKLDVMVVLILRGRVKKALAEPR